MCRLCVSRICSLKARTCCCIHRRKLIRTRLLAHRLVFVSLVSPGFLSFCPLFHFSLSVCSAMFYFCVPSFKEPVCLSHFTILIGPFIPVSFYKRQKGSLIDCDPRKAAQVVRYLFSLMSFREWTTASYSWQGCFCMSFDLCN